MSGLALLFISLAPALGGIAIWVVWKYAKDHIEHREELRRRELEQYRSGINPALSEEIERLR